MSSEISTKAVSSAYKYLVSALVASGSKVESLSNFRVEEVQQDGVDGNFKITLSYEVASDFPFDKKREYKDFQIDKGGEKVISMTIRKV